MKGVREESGEELLELISQLKPAQGNGQPVQAEGGDVPDRFVIPARAAALGSLFVAIVCLTALILVVSVEGAAVLSTVALALALLAFVIQIAVFIHQSSVSHQQILQSEQIFTETRALLTEVRTAANSTEILVRDQFAALLRAFIDSTPGEKQEEKLLGTLRAELLPLLEAGEKPPRFAHAQLERLQEQNRANRQAARLFADFPSQEEGAEILQKLIELGSAELRRIRTLAEDEQEMTRSLSRDRIGERLVADDRRLIALGLAERARLKDFPSDKMETVTRLTDHGRIAARLLLGTGAVPPYAEDGLETLQARLAAGSPVSN